MSTEEPDKINSLFIRAMFQSHSGDAIKVAGINMTALIVSLSDIESAVRIAGLLAALIYTCLKIWDWVSSKRAEKARTGASVVPLLILLFTLNACAAPRGVPPSTLDATRSIQSASVGAVRARASAARAQASVKTAADAVTILEKTAAAVQRPAVVTIKDSLQAARTEIHEAEAQLIAASNSIAESDGHLHRLQLEVDAQAAKLIVAERRAAAYHRLKFWLAAAAAGFAFYAAMRMVPPLGPYTWWIAGGAAVMAGGIVFSMI